MSARVARARRWLGERLVLIYGVLVLCYLALPVLVVVLMSFNEPASRQSYTFDAFTWGNWLDIDVSRWEALLSFAHESGTTEKLLTPAQVWDGSLMKGIFSFDRTTL